MKNPNRRLYEIDYLRGIACLAVVAFHYFSRSPKVGWMPGAIYPGIEEIARYGYFGVHLFFVISGFVIFMSAKDATAGSFVASRVGRLFPAFWVAAAITVATAWMLNDERFQISLTDFLINLTMLPHWFNVPYVDGAYWSLAVELHFYIYVWIAIKLKLMRRIEWLLLTWLAVSALNLLRPAWPVEFWLNAKWAPFFVAGAVFYLIWKNGFHGLRVLLLVMSWLLSLMYNINDMPASGINAWIACGIITAIFLIFLAISMDALKAESSRLAITAGLLTYPVYVIHQNFGAMVYTKIMSIMPNSGYALAATFLMVLLVSWIIHFVVEKKLGPILVNTLNNMHKKQSTGLSRSEIGL